MSENTLESDNDDNWKKAKEYMTVIKLKVMCKRLGIVNYSKLTRPKLITILDTHFLTHPDSIKLAFTPNKTDCATKKIPHIEEQPIDISCTSLRKTNYKFIDLFCGMGSFHYSFSKLGMQCIMASDIDEHARTIYNLNYKLKPLGDIVNIDPKDIPYYDILCAGFSCQPFSNIGQHKGFDDEKRGTMFYQIIKFAKFHKPKIIVLENVQGLLKHDNGQTLVKMVDMLRENGYKTKYKLLKCSDYGIPQMRKRLFIVSIIDQNGNDFPDNWDNWDELKVAQPTLSNFMGKKFVKPIAYTIRCGGRRSPINDKHNWDGYIVDKKEYRLTPTDCLKLQGFPDNFILDGTESQKFQRLGNTIPTNLTELIGKKCLHLLKSMYDQNNARPSNILHADFPEISPDILEQIYNKSISIFQSNKCNSGKLFEKHVEQLLTENEISFRSQVSINDDGFILGTTKTHTTSIVDIIVGDVVDGTHISDYIVLSCKTTCRERWKQDGWTLKHIPKLFILITKNSDYPQPDVFKESVKRKIITDMPKKTDTRLFKISLNDIIDEIKKID